MMECALSESEIGELVLGAVAVTTIVWTMLLGTLQCCRVSGPIGPRLVGVITFYYFVWTLAFGATSGANLWGDFAVAVAGTTLYGLTSTSPIWWPIVAGILFTVNAHACLSLIHI